MVNLVAKEMIYSRTLVKMSLGLIMVLFAFLSCTHRQEAVRDVTCTTLDQDMDSLFKGIEMTIFRPSRDTINLVYCFKFQNGRKCIAQMRLDSGNGFFVDVKEHEIDSLKHSFIDEEEYFKEFYGCDVTQIQEMVRFCSENNFYSVTRYNDGINPTARYTCHTPQSVFFYSRDSVFFNEEKYKHLGQHWYTLK